MHKLMILPSVALLIAAAPVASPPALTNQIAPSDLQQSIGIAGGGAKPAQAPEQRMVCRQLPSSNSRLPNRVCLTDRQWQQVDEDLSH